MYFMLIEISKTLPNFSVNKYILDVHGEQKEF